MIYLDVIFAGMDWHSVQGLHHLKPGDNKDKLQSICDTEQNKQWRNSLIACFCFFFLLW